jgi:hypothetical protein
MPGSPGNPYGRLVYYTRIPRGPRIISTGMFPSFHTRADGADGAPRAGQQRP